jgi:hypothetical protein
MNLTTIMLQFYQDEVDGETALHLLTRAATGPLNGMLDWAVVQLKDHGIFHLRFVFLFGFVACACASSCGVD